MLPSSVLELGEGCVCVGYTQFGTFAQEAWLQPSRALMTLPSSKARRGPGTVRFPGGTQCHGQVDEEKWDN